MVIRVLQPEDHAETIVVVRRSGNRCRLHAQREIGEIGQRRRIGRAVGPVNVQLHRAIDHLRFQSPLVLLPLVHEIVKCRGVQELARIAGEHVAIIGNKPVQTKQC